MNFRDSQLGMLLLDVTVIVFGCVDEGISVVLKSATLCGEHSTVF